MPIYFFGQQLLACCVFKSFLLSRAQLRLRQAQEEADVPTAQQNARAQELHKSVRVRIVYQKYGL